MPQLTEAQIDDFVARARRAYVRDQIEFGSNMRSCGHLCLFLFLVCTELCFEQSVNEEKESAQTLPQSMLGMMIGILGCCYLMRDMYQRFGLKAARFAGSEDELRDKALQSTDDEYARLLAELEVHEILDPRVFANPNQLEIARHIGYGASLFLSRKHFGTAGMVPVVAAALETEYFEVKQLLG